MATAPLPRTYSPADFLSMPDRDRFELINGRLVERRVDARAAATADRIAWALGDLPGLAGAARIFGGDRGYRCVPGRPDRVRRAHVSVVLRHRWPGGPLAEEGWIKTPPDLAVHVISAGDLAEAVAGWTADLLGAGARLLWIVYPRFRYLWVFRADRTGNLRRAGEWVDGEGVLPGLSLPVADLFPPPAPGEGPPRRDA